jgi:hypothetical protein
VALLVDRQQEAGRHEVEFQARDLPSGMYFFTLQANGYTEVRTMLLMK